MSGRMRIAFENTGSDATGRKLDTTLRDNQRRRTSIWGPPGRGNLLYITPGTPPQLLNDVRVPVAITEGAKKTIALHRLSTTGIPDNQPPRFLAVGLGGAWSFKGTIGKTVGADGSRRDEKGLIPDLCRLSWSGRRAYAFSIRTFTPIRKLRPPAVS